MLEQLIDKDKMLGEIAETLAAGMNEAIRTGKTEAEIDEIRAKAFDKLRHEWHGIFAKEFIDSSLASLEAQIRLHRGKRLDS